MKNKKTFYVDNVGSFDPEFIYGYLYSTKILGNEEIYSKMKYISHARSYQIGDLLSILLKLRIMDYSCIVFDDLLAYFSYQRDRHVKEEVRTLVREIALLAVIKRVCIVFTNPIVKPLNNKFPLRSTYELRYNDIIRYIHVKANVKKGIQNSIDCEFVYPMKLEKTRLTIIPHKAKNYRI